MPSSPDRFSVKRLWRRLAGDSNKQVAAPDMSVNTSATPGNTPQSPSPAAGIALPPLLIVPDSAGHVALALTLAPVALWGLATWLSSRGRSTSR